MIIRIVNLRSYKAITNEVLIKVDRSSPLGNPFIMYNESERDDVCEKYDKWFAEQMTNPESKAFQMIKDILEINKTKNIALGCWCVPKRCHAETIRAFITSIPEEKK